MDDISLLAKYRDKIVLSFRFRLKKVKMTSHTLQIPLPDEIVPLSNRATLPHSVSVCSICTVVYFGIMCIKNSDKLDLI